MKETLLEAHVDVTEKRMAEILKLFHFLAYMLYQRFKDKVLLICKVKVLTFVLNKKFLIVFAAVIVVYMSSDIFSISLLLPSVKRTCDMVENCR